ncbi:MULTISPECIES: glutamyl-tRNA reductase [unclassified Corynebacterium]|uniref:glutamyl-tRNA reductase n=1 Tax=unclassified Corynebacterium TaxID=2624378 RepID=UPI001EF5682C|nr:MULTISPECIES: glutamyl-tRNA reductase [unclassified Corynebacterium]MCG7258373.1 glutamyl-tRNA reductase [Corynebacterium sp. ACRQK]MCG7262918.1 glutamyl-tRNA reductase [Corynebacterium sp. ACRQL]
MSSSTRTGSASVLLVGLSFRSAPVTMLEQATVADADLPKMQLSLVDSDVISESLVLSTCNRMEFYTVANAFHSGLDHVVDTIAQFSGLETTQLEPHLYVHYADSAAEHMLKVASGLDSMVIGEQQIIGQLRSAYQSANETGTVGRTLHDLTQRALRTGKRVHSETAIDSAGASMVSFAVDQALRYIEPVRALSAVVDDAPSSQPLAGHRALIIGAGAMASLASTHLGRLGIDHVTVANRTLSRAENLVNHAREAGVDSSAVPLDGVADCLSAVDIVVSATGAVGNVVTERDVRAAMGAAGAKVLVDLSMPADIERSVADIDGVKLLNIEELTTMAGDRVQDEDPARAIVADELQSFLEQQRAQSVVPTVKALRQKAGEVMAEELMTLERLTPDMSETDRAAVVKSMKRVVDKLLHTPTVQAKKLSAGGQQVSYPDALAALFNLPNGMVDSVTRPGQADSSAAQTAGTSARADQIPSVARISQVAKEA